MIRHPQRQVKIMIPSRPSSCSASGLVSSSPRRAAAAASARSHSRACRTLRPVYISCGLKSSETNSWENMACGGGGRRHGKQTRVRPGRSIGKGRAAAGPSRLASASASPPPRAARARGRAGRAPSRRRSARRRPSRMGCSGPGGAARGCRASPLQAGALARAEGPGRARREEVKRRRSASDRALEGGGRPGAGGRGG